MTVKKLTCEERDAILEVENGRVSDNWSIYASLSDAHGEYGEPLITTTWEREGRLIKDVRHPFEGSYSLPDREPCEHFELDKENQ